jgi:small subunit ribosomal protein S6
MFLLDSKRGGEELPSLIQHISNLLSREDARIERIEQWDERKLAYRIQGADRGIYVLVYFRAEPERIQEMRNTINLSEDILRVLILTAEEIPPAVGQLYNTEGEEVEAPPEEPETEAVGAESEGEESAQDD